MKNIKLTKAWVSPLIMIMLLSFAGLQLNAQPAKPTPPPPPGMRFVDRIPDLTTEQKAKIEAFHTTMSKEILPLENQILEKEARLRTLTTAEKVDMKAVNKTIDEISKLRGEIQKKRMKFMMDTRSILTEDQRVTFDRMRMHKMNGAKRGNRAKAGTYRGGRQGRGGPHHGNCPR
jgi:Spy/CpxP family protein refolding chaperone